MISLGKTTKETAELMQILVRTIQWIYSRAVKRGFDLVQCPITISEAFVADVARSGRPKKQTEEVQQKLLTKVRFDRFGREKTYTDLAGELSSEGIIISALTIWTVLQKAGLRKMKLTRKPGLT